MTDLTLPQLSISMEEGRVLRWLVADGEDVSEGQPVVEIETDKATMEIEAPTAGILRIQAAEGGIVPIDGVLAVIGDGEPQAPEPEPAVEPEAPEVEAVTEPEVPRPTPPSEPAARADGAGKPIASPAARRIAAERAIELSSVQGSGPGGRVVARDLERVPSAAAVPQEQPRPSLREAVVAGLSASWREIPHIHIGAELGADGLAAAWRAAPPGTPKVTVTDLLILALAAALGEVPELNGLRQRDGSVKRSERVDLSLAVATSGGVVAPVIRDAAARTLREVAAERHRLVEAARAGQLDARDLATGSCTLSNLGGYPVDFFAPVVFGPQIAMVATGRIAERPVAENRWIGIRPRIWVNVAIDHRAADGEAGGRLLAALERQFALLPGGVT